ncbi:hypothetical protein ACX9MO_09700 [Pseudooceanicola sp. 502str34]
MSGIPSFSEQMRPAHLSTVKALGYALTLGDSSAWWGLVPVFAARLTREERAHLAFMVLKSLDPEASCATAAAAGIGIGHPLPPLLGVMDDATRWATWASPAELDAYCLACFKAMRPGRQAAFLDYVSGRAAA